MDNKITIRDRIKIQALLTILYFVSELVVFIFLYDNTLENWM